MPTKADLIKTVDTLTHEVRRLNRALNLAEIDLKVDDQEKKVYWPTPAIDPKSREALDRGLNEWRDVVLDPSPRINTYIRTQQGINWTWEPVYKNDKDFAWCGAFAAFCWQSVKLEIRKSIFPSCYRLFNAWGQSSRKISADQMMPGDIVVVFSTARKSYGDHITLCMSPPNAEGEFETIEGNAYGELGNGSYGQGVITRTRNLNGVAHVYRFLGSDFNE